MNELINKIIGAYNLIDKQNPYLKLGFHVVEFPTFTIEAIEVKENKLILYRGKDGLPIEPITPENTTIEALQAVYDSLIEIGS